MLESISLDEKVLVNTEDIAGGKVDLNTFPTKVSAFDVAPYQGKYVQLSGCAPTWAHLLVAAKLFPVISGLDFLIDDGKDGKKIEIVKP